MPAEMVGTILNVQYFLAIPGWPYRSMLFKLTSIPLCWFFFIIIYIYNILRNIQYSFYTADILSQGFWNVKEAIVGGLLCSVDSICVGDSGIILVFFLFELTIYCFCCAGEIACRYFVRPCFQISNICQGLHDLSLFRDRKNKSQLRIRVDVIDLAPLSKLMVCAKIWN